MSNKRIKTLLVITKREERRRETREGKSMLARYEKQPHKQFLSSYQSNQKGVLNHD